MNRTLDSFPLEHLFSWSKQTRGSTGIDKAKQDPNTNPNSTKRVSDLINNYNLNHKTKVWTHAIP